MLVGLTIRDIVLIDRLSLSLKAGLNVLTGETGAGKSILLDALGLALGTRADSALVRPTADQGVVIATFDVGDDHPAVALLHDHGLEPDATLILRRVVSADGRSRAFANDQPVSVGLLRQLGETLVEIHGQHDDRGLLNAAAHRALLDAFGGHHALAARTRRSHAALAAARATLDQVEAAHGSAQADEAYLRHTLDELTALAPEPGEEARLADTRAAMMQGERAAGELDQVHRTLTADGGIDATLRGVLRRLERLEDEVRQRLAPAIEALDRAAIETAEGLAALEETRRAVEYDPARLERLEERLFALRALARKHGCGVDALAALKDEVAAKLGSIEDGGRDVTAARRAVDAAQATLADDVAALSQARRAAAERLAEAVAGELAPLKLDKARFQARLEPLDADAWTGEGGERVAFEVSTNPGAPFGPLVKIASGGELARFVLALKVVLARTGSAPTLIFDEVDRGIGGATAHAVGERLARLADAAQVLVVTHSPQVAARGATHWRIDKQERTNGGAPATVTDVAELDAAGRREEIARMLSGQAVTDQARAAADSLLDDALSA